MQKKVICILKSAEQISKDLDKVKNNLLKKVEQLILEKKKLYSNMDISEPMSAKEKQLDQEISEIFSEINKIVTQKRQIKR
jgi:hypothetical protein